MRQCRECKKIFEGSPGNKGFCSNSCGAIFNHKIKFPRIFLNCLECGIKMLGKERRKKFCNHSCAAKFNNRKRGFYSNNKKEKCICGNKKFYTAKVCHRCNVLNTIEKNKKEKIKDFISKGNARVKYSRIRGLASKIMKFNNIKKECFYCGFSIVVQVCHIKKISEFSEESLIGEVNSLKNLMYLCPNHHSMLDKGLLDLSTKNKE